jgi:ABC-type sugar transport system ATPase subunit
VSIVFVSHRMSEMLEVSDRVTVLRDGSHVADARIGEVDESWLVQRMVGRELSLSHTRAREAPGAAVCGSAASATSRRVSTTCPSTSAQARSSASPGSSVRAGPSCWRR